MKPFPDHAGSVLLQADPTGGRLSDWATSAWSAELAKVSGTPITVRDIAVSIIVVVVGFFLSRIVSHLLTRLLARRFQMTAGGAATIQTLSFYVLFAVTVVTALGLANFPLTAFTIAGGALAIGIGFGSQNLMNNFMSGLILLVERPVRVADLVLIQGTHGTVEHIGARSTRIRTVDNTQMILPNSFFLENAVVNYTLSDDVLRSQIEVGIVYGSPTRQAAELIHKAITEQEKILSDPRPRVLFEAFGDNSLVFQVLFWIRARTILERREIQSELMYRIDDLFREADIVIAFPQRDVHLDASQPVPVRVVSERPEK